MLTPFGDSEKNGSCSRNLFRIRRSGRNLAVLLQARAHERFSARIIVPRYETLYRGGPAIPDATFPKPPPDLGYFGDRTGELDPAVAGSKFA